MNDCCGFCAANRGSVEKPAAGESLSTLKIYVACLSHHPQWQVHPGDHLSEEFYEALKFTAAASGFKMEEAGPRVSPEGEPGLFASGLFFRFMGATQDFRGP